MTGERYTANERVLLICRWTLGVLWLYQGIVPKLLGPDSGELLMNRALGWGETAAHQIAYVGGVSEAMVGLLVIVAYRRASVYWFTIAAMIGLLVYVLIMTPVFLTAAFNAVTINLAMGALSLIAIEELRRLSRAAPQT